MEINTKAEIKNLNCRVEAHGDEYVPAVDVKMLLLSVPVNQLGAFCPDIGNRFYDGDLVAVGEINPFPVHHKIENVKAVIGGVELNGADIKKGTKIRLLPERFANVELTVQGQHYDNVAVEVLGMLRAEVDVSINERQLKIVGAK